MRRSVEKVALVKPKLVFNDGNLRGFHCADAAGADTWRYEFFDTNNKLVKVWSRPVSAQERQARFNNALYRSSYFEFWNSIRNNNTKSSAFWIFSFDIASGMNKVCFYDQLGSLSAKTIGRAEICPLGY